MSANCAPCLSQLVHAATPNPIEVEKTALKVKFIVASMALVTEARCIPDDKEELWEEKVMWMHRWEERTGEVYPIVKRGQELGIDTKIDAADGPAIVEANEAYERWVAKEIARRMADEDMRMGEETVQAVGEQGASVTVPAVTEKMSHVEVVAQPVQKRSWQTVAESEDEDEPKIVIPPGSILHKLHVQRLRADEAKVQEVNEGRGKESAGRRISRSTKASPSKRAVDDDEVEVVKSHTRVKGKAPAAESQAAYLRLPVCIDQFTEALEKIGVE
ncbi:hypothetical protein M404DRAFT_30079 [Pisolithus tinctorius Marx 270]|uniref:Uncharacterized protein n=1 Tax=Pisolithus tinctorius Marx 270 TaxID=870435 RepID=A0A0C3NFM7_PISTI|nr:hypothetical protein M404DRAFT_30079 [Pisolithus tinctorius Marx 270]